MVFGLIYNSNQKLSVNVYKKEKLGNQSIATHGKLKNKNKNLNVSNVYIINVFDKFHSISIYKT